MRIKIIDMAQFPLKNHKKSGPGWIRTSDPTIMSRLR